MKVKKQDWNVFSLKTLSYLAFSVNVLFNIEILNFTLCPLKSKLYPANQKILMLEKSLNGFKA